jgi:hypothetical protein
VFVSLEILGTVVIHAALMLAAWLYAGFLAQPHIYKAYHPHNTYWTVIGGELLVGVAFGLQCIVADAWIRTAPLVVAALFITLQGAAAIPIIRWQRKQAEEEKERERAAEARLAAEERYYGD